jgi:hypothetical protein
MWKGAWTWRRIHLLKKKEQKYVEKEDLNKKEQQENTNSMWRKKNLGTN